MNLFQHNKNSDTVIKKNINPLNEFRSQVAVIDGVFMATKKSIWVLNKFNQTELTGFHGYDLDFCLQIGQSKKLFVVYDILMDHFSSGNTNIDWLQTVLKIHVKWAKQLPIIITQCDTHSVYENGWQRLRKNMEFLLRGKNNFTTVIKNYNQYCSLLDARPHLVKFLADYFRGLAKIIKRYFAKGIPN